MYKLGSRLYIEWVIERDSTLDALTYLAFSKESFSHQKFNNIIN
jgi:hypothetical protein